MLKLAAIVGPTGVGKSEIAVQTAEIIGRAEIISCDSMQIYRYMDIGTAKTTREEMRGIPHHMIDVVNPDEPFSVLDYQQAAVQLIKEITGRGNLPILVGGTGLYYQSVVDDYDLQPMDKRPEIRNALEREADEKGNLPLYERLVAADPQAAAKIQPGDRKRIIRALEVMEITGQPFSAQQLKRPGKYDLTVIGLTLPRETLYERINLRVERMIASGWIEETERLLKMGYSEKLNSMQALGYAHLAGYLLGQHSLAEAAGLIKQDTRRYAKRQLTWFRKDGRIKFIDVAEYTDAEGFKPNISMMISRTIADAVE